jgi:hypothetical protein
MFDFVVKPRQVVQTEEVKPQEERKVELYDYEPTDLERQIIRMVEKTHPQLSPMLLWNLCVVFARYGNINLAIRGCGKSAVLKCIMNHVTKDDQLINNLKQNPDEARKYIPIHIWVDAGFTPMYVADTMIPDPITGQLIPLYQAYERYPVQHEVDDFCTFLVSARETMLHTFMFLSTVTYNKCYYGRVRGHPTIRQSDVGTIGSGTYEFGKEAMGLGLWTGNVQDRFIRYYHFYLNFPRIEDLPLIEENPPKIPDIYYKPLPDMPDSTSIEMFKMVRNMFAKQMTEARAEIVARRMLTAHAFINNKSMIDDDDCKFLLLFRPFIEIESSFVQRVTVEAEGIAQSRGLAFNDIAPEILFYVCYKPVTMDEIVERTNYKKEVIRRTLTKLARAGFVTENDGTWECSGNFRRMLEHVYRCLGK